ncbi:MAG: CDP-diacylglycerol--serine O-phosphatidyltransferase [Candidatus Angelobacter sp.]|jgi:CDP-diacylglycerol--serine O-phosphatidyltransferase|nr:CDP-diacylglycerol--serine O-phosphatidyltransferase [Candidatus Angelobacter sp.]
MPQQLPTIQEIRRSKRVRKGMYILPSLFTAGNIAAGYFAIAQTFQASITGDFSRFDWAAKAIGFAIFFDGLDGRIARMTNTTSEFGKQLDSLADVITFGVAPAFLAYAWGVRYASAPFGNPEWQAKLVQLGAIVTFLFLTAGASRLARFNIQINPQPSNPGRPGRKYFVGMAIPAGAGVIASVVHLAGGEPIEQWWLSVVWVLLVFATGFLMVSTWRFYSPKDIDLKKQHPFTAFVLIAGLVAAIWFFSKPVLFFMAMTYMLYGVLSRLAYILRKPSAQVSGEQQLQEQPH